MQDGERSVTVRRVGGTQFVAALYHTVPGAHPDAVAFEALGEVMTVEPAGRLYRALVETKKASAVEAWNFMLADPGNIIFWAQVPLADSLAAARDALIATVEGVRAKPITAAEVDRVRAKALRQFDETFNDPQKLGVAISESIATGDWRLFFLQRDQWRKLTPADVQRVALDYLKPSNRTLGQFIPDAKPDRAPTPPAADIAAMVKDYKGDASVAAGESFEPTPANLEARTQRFALPNGMKVALAAEEDARRDGAAPDAPASGRRDVAQGHVAARQPRGVHAGARHEEARPAGVRGHARPAAREALRSAAARRRPRRAARPCARICPSCCGSPPRRCASRRFRRPSSRS